jgi:hypothetical protein
MTTIAKTDPTRIEVSAQIPQDLADGLAKGLYVFVSVRPRGVSPQDLADGLAKGHYERFGGAIRDATSKETTRGCAR